MTLTDVYEKLVDPICALEEVCENTQQTAMVNTIATALRSVLNELDDATCGEFREELTDIARGMRNK